MKIWVTKNTPYHWVAGGADRSHFWFVKPHFKKSMVHCPLMGALNHSTIEPARWSSGYDAAQVSLKYLRKTQNKLFLQIWDDICGTYRDGVNQDNVINLDTKYQLEWYKLAGRRRYDTAMSNSLTRDALDHYCEEEAAMYSECRLEKDGQSWREWIGEYEINMDLV